MKARVFVTLRPGILDPAGKAVAQGLAELGFDEVRGVRIGKVIDLDLGEGASVERIEQMCRRLLANPVIEDYRVEIDDQPDGETCDG